MRCHPEEVAVATYEGSAVAFSSFPVEHRSMPDCGCTLAHLQLTTPEQNPEQVSPVEFGQGRRTRNQKCFQLAQSKENSVACNLACFAHNQRDWIPTFG